MKHAASLAIAAGLGLAMLAGPAAASDKARADYILHCSGCHGMAGNGTVEGGIPAFPNSVGHIAGYENGRNYMLQVPGVITTDMDAAEIAGVLNYILEEWSDDIPAAPFTAQEVTMRRALPARDVVDYRREIARELMTDGIQIAEYPWP